MDEQMTRVEIADDYITTTFGSIHALKCKACNGIFFDVDDVFEYCPICGRVIENEE